MIYPQTVTYALNALCHLSRNEKGPYVKVRELAMALNIPRHFLGKVLTQLVRKQLLVSSKGPTGGIALARSPDAITIADVLIALDALPSVDNYCILGFAHCEQPHSCPFHDDWSDFQNRIMTSARETTLSALAGVCT